MEKKLSKILIIDDDEDILTIAKVALSAIPESQIVCVNGGSEGIKTALEFLPDLILLDLMMPNMDGKSTLQAIRLLPSIAETPIVFFTARVQPHEIGEYYKMGVLDVLMKPFDPIGLPDQVRAIWNKREK